MQDIDFLPSKYREASAERRTRYYGVLVMAAFFSLLAVAFAGQCALRAHVARELDQVRDQYNRVLVHSNRLAALERQRIPCDAEAQLDTLLRQPWPRTQIIAGILAVLPEPIALVKLRIDRQAASGAMAQAGATPGIIAPGTAAASQEEKLLPTERDLRRLKQESKRHETVVDIEGITDDALTLHTYLGKLASLGLFSAAELTSIDRLEKSSMSRFQARLVVRPGHVDAPSPPATGIAQSEPTQPQRNSP
jgi:hypothetical protein